MPTRTQQPRGQWIRRFEFVAVLAVVLLPAADVAVGGRFWWLTALGTFHLYLLALPAVGGLVALVTGRGRAHGPLVLAIPALLAFYGPQMVPAAAFSDPVPPREPLVLMTWNVRATAAQADRLVEGIRESGADVVALQEVVRPDLETSGLLDRLRADGWSCEYRGYLADHPNTGIALCVRPPIRILQATPRTYHSAGTWSYLFSEVAVGERVVNLVLPHFLAFRIKEENPLQAAPRILEKVRSTVAWHRQEAAALLELLDRLEDPTFLVGDFNSTPWQAVHVSLRRRLDDAWAVAGLGLGATFRYFVPLRIDYVYVPPGTRVVDCSVGPDATSDHRPVIVRIDLATLPRRDPPG